MDQPGSPDSQRLTSSGCVKALKTMARGALKTRVITISRSPCTATCKPSDLFINYLLMLPIADASFLLGAHLVQQSVQPLEVALPELPVFFQPHIRLRSEEHTSELQS